MTTEVFTYSYARNHLAQLLDSAEDTTEPIIIKRRKHADVALISSAELRSLEETAHLLRSPKNAQRLMAALKRAIEETASPTSSEELRDELGI